MSHNSLHAERIKMLQSLMRQHSVQACIIPSADPHLSEYLPEYWQVKRWFTGFTGSMGTLVVTPDFAGLWADGRYWIQAEKQLQGSGVTLQKLMSQQNMRAHIDWLAERLPAGAAVVVDGNVLSLSAQKLLNEILGPRGIKVETNLDLVGLLWNDRPALPANPVYEHPLEFEERSREQKLAALREEMRARGATRHILSSLDDIAWLLNLRGTDVPYNPVFLAHMRIDLERAVLFSAPDRFPPELAQALERAGVTLAPYEDAATTVAAIQPGETILLDPGKVSLALIGKAAEGVTVIEAINPTTLAKACKSAKEIAHIHHAMEEDGAALCEFFAWIEAALERGETLTEMDIDARVTGPRSARPLYLSPSFQTMAAFNVNAASPHYMPSEQEHAVIAGDGLLLLDCGAQYHDGTTDISRIIPVGKMSPEQKRDATLVLKGLIAMTELRFPEGTEGPLLDVVARAPLWAEQVDYRNGTGHGVGYCMNVHEGPQVLSYFAPVLPQGKLREGMILSIEPGVYRPGKYGLRIENLVAVRKVEKPKETAFGPFLRFENLTLCPIDARCLELGLLSQAEKDRLNDYHVTVYERLSPKVTGEALAWLRKRTLPV